MHSAPLIPLWRLWLKLAVVYTTLNPVACSHLKSALGFLSLKLGAPLWRPCKQNWARMQEIAHSSLPTSSNSQGPPSCHCSLVPGSTDLQALGSHSLGLASCLCCLVPSQLFNFTSSCFWQKTTTAATLVSQSTSSISLVMLSLCWNIPSRSFCLTNMAPRSLLLNSPSHSKAALGVSIPRSCNPTFCYDHLLRWLALSIQNSAWHVVASTWYVSIEWVNEWMNEWIKSCHDLRDPTFLAMYLDLSSQVWRIHLILVYFIISSLSSTQVHYTVLPS